MLCMLDIGCCLSPDVLDDGCEAVVVLALIDRPLPLDEGERDQPQGGQGGQVVCGHAQGGCLGSAGAPTDVGGVVGFEDEESAWFEGSGHSVVYLVRCRQAGEVWMSGWVVERVGWTGEGWEDWYWVDSAYTANEKRQASED